MKTDPFREYLIQAEPGRREKGYVWNTAIGLQAVDGLKPSQYLVDTAVQNIEGKITIEEAQYLVDSYYEERREKPKPGDRTEEADKVSARIAALLSENAFSLHLQNIWQFIRNYLQEFIRMPEKSGIITLQKKNGY